MLENPLRLGSPWGRHLWSDNCAFAPSPAKPFNAPVDLARRLVCSLFNLAFRLSAASCALRVFVAPGLRALLPLLRRNNLCDRVSAGGPRLIVSS
jgi:hypothetical protein